MYHTHTCHYGVGANADALHPNTCTRYGEPRRTPTQSIQNRSVSLGYETRKIFCVVTESATMEDDNTGPKTEFILSIRCNYSKQSLFFLSDTGNSFNSKVKFKDYDCKWFIKLGTPIRYDAIFDRHCHQFKTPSTVRAHSCRHTNARNAHISYLYTL